MTFYLYATGRLFVVKANTEADAREKMRERLNIKRCPNNTRIINPIELK